VYVQEISLSGPDPTPPTPFSRFFLWILGGALVSVWSWFAQKRKQHVLIIITEGLLLGFSWYLVGCNLKGWLESMRAAWIPWRWLPLLVPLILGFFFRFTIESFRMLRGLPFSIPTWIPFVISLILVQLAPPLSGSWERILAAVIVLIIPFAILLLMQFLLPSSDRRHHLLGFWGLVGTIAISMTNPIHIWGSVWFYITALSWASLIWANHNASKIRGYNLFCLAASVLIICSMEGMLRGSKAGVQWSNHGAKTELNDIFGWISTANEDFALLEEGKHTSYPSRGYPVSFSPTKEKKRIISFGGSTTGGAFQNDDIKQFYPAKLSKLLPTGWEVINQGVGGWTSWHITEYAKRKQALLKPDIITLYIGHNDLLTFTPLPYADLYKKWRQSPNAKSLSTTLGQFRLYHALRHFLVSLRPATQKVAVPIKDAKKNIESIISTFGSDTPLLLLSEGLAPDPSPLERYNNMLKELSDNYPNVYYTDVAQYLHEYPSTDIYLDDCHLTSTGHELVAEQIYTILKTNNILETK
jgi:lysophospholipase L1-like esterase